MGHLGLTPQAVHAMGGFKVQGKNPQAAQELSTMHLRSKGQGHNTVLEGIPTELARVITQSLPTIGIRAGVTATVNSCDLRRVGMSLIFSQIRRKYLNLGELIPEAVRNFRKVKLVSFYQGTLSASLSLHRSVDTPEEDDDVIGLYGVPVELG